MTQKEQIKLLKTRIKNLEATGERLRKELAEVTDDRSKFRDHFASDLKWLIELLGKNTSPKMDAYVLNKSRFLNTVKGWYW